MLEEIIEKTTTRNDKTVNDKDKFPKHLPSSHSKYVTQRTTFGQVRVDLPAKSDQRQLIESLYKNYDPTNEQYRTFDERIWSLVDDDIDTSKHDIDFYGLINAHYRNITFEQKLSSPKEELSDNYIDQLAFPELTTKKAEFESKPSIEKETIEQLKNEEMNPIDEQYFGTLKQINYQEEQTVNTTPIKRIEMPPADELNYIDQLVFNSLEKASITSDKQPNPIQSEKLIKTPSITSDEQQNANPSENSTSDNLIDINFQFRISTPTQKRMTKSVPDPNESPMDTYNPKLETMRSIKSKDYFDPPRRSSLDIQKDNEMDSSKSAHEPAEHIREQIKKKASDRDSLGYRTFDNLTPKWWKMTKAEIVDILIKQICFMRHGILALDKPFGGPGVQISIAHFIPQIIERLNRPDIKQLHLLHRLDKQSTGLLLMAYTPEAEKRLRDLM
ncbi:unnamed protein product, partial [Adineta steineri]